jgi:hypothetical protein
MKSFRIAAMILLFFLLAFEAWAMTPVRPKEPEGVKAEGVKKSQDPRTAPAPVSPVRKVMEFVQKIEDGVLYTQGGQYKLTGVKVLDLTNSPKVEDPTKVPKKTAELTFVNDKLQEVVIRQRR